MLTGFMGKTISVAQSAELEYLQEIYSHQRKPRLAICITEVESVESVVGTISPGRCLKNRRLLLSVKRLSEELVVRNLSQQWWGLESRQRLMVVLIVDYKQSLDSRQFCFPERHQNSPDQSDLSLRHALKHGWCHLPD